MNRRPTVSVRSSSVGARANDYGGALWVDPVVHASGCRRFDSYVVRGPGAINAPIHECPRKWSPSRRRLPANVMMWPDAIGSGESMRRAHNSLPRRNRVTFGVMI